RAQGAKVCPEEGAVTASSHAPIGIGSRTAAAPWKRESIDERPFTAPAAPRQPTGAERHARKRDGMHRILACVTLGVLVSTSSTTPVAARDWPSWRGPENLGISRETKLPGTWSPEGENVLWEKPYGARSAPVVFRGRVYILNRTYGDVNEDERLACLDAETGDLIWEDRF